MTTAQAHCPDHVSAGSTRFGHPASVPLDTYRSCEWVPHRHGAHTRYRDVVKSTIRRMIAPTVMIFALGLLGACADEAVADDDVCDEYEATDYGDDCGYWADDGSGTVVWLWYVWVEPYHGGTPPAGSKPTPPSGAKVAAPPKNKPALPPGVNKPVAPKPPANPPKPPANPPKPPPPVKGK